MTKEHPITPPPELVKEWRDLPEYLTTKLQGIATQAARWGADQELEACCADIHALYGKLRAESFRAARRPKPPSLKELNLKHLEVMERDGHYLPEIIADLRRAIESLPD